MTTRATIGQRGRLVILVIYLAGLFIASRIAFNTWFPPTGEDGIWFYSALASLLLGSLLVTPFYTKPVDAISYAVVALVALLAFNTWAMPDTAAFDRFVWSAVLMYVLSILAASVIAIVGKDATSSFVRNCSHSALVLTDAIGGPRAVFSVIFWFALVTFHREEPREYLVLSLAWILFVGLRPLESATQVWEKWQGLWLKPNVMPLVGSVLGHEAPGLVLIREAPDSNARFGDVLHVRGEDGKPGQAMTLDHVGFSEGRWLRAIHLAEAIDLSERLSDRWAIRALENGSVLAQSDQANPGSTNPQAKEMRERLVGLVAPDTTIGHVQIELVRTDTGLQEGRLVEVPIQDRPVLYQVVKGLTKEEILQEKNKRGYVRAQAKKIGMWDAEENRFDHVPWLPQPNVPVLLTEAEDAPIEREAIGHFPGTSYPVTIDSHLLVTHNAAILGILGIGKSFLALELVERMLDQGVRVICLDLTDQYARKLQPFFDVDHEAAILKELEEIGPRGRGNVNRNVEEGGSIREFRSKIAEQLIEFLKPDSPHKLRILNPAQFEVWRQDSRPFNNQASMASLTPTEVTRIITESALEVLQQQGMTDQARCCIVYEEAHSLIPEWNAVASEGDKAATNGTAKAILQGRKFGLGCMVITQRTANVTKTILNQCNTIFGLRVFDATGVEFLRNYIGEDYAGVLSTLEERHAVVFGRASSCNDPVLTRLNDRDVFLRTFRSRNRQGEQRDS